MNPRDHGPHALWPYLLGPEDQGDSSRCAVSAHGHRIQFANGQTVLDGTSGLWNVNLGYGDPGIADAIAGAARSASYLGSFRYENVLARQAADDLVEVAGPNRYARVIFSTSGGAANDLAMKLVRHAQALLGHPHRRIIVSLQNSFHGLTFGGFALTGEDLGQRVYGVDTTTVVHTPPNDVQALHALMDRYSDQVAAIVLEPVQGTGTLPLERDFLEAVGQLRDREGYLVVADEVATGFGRTGTFFASSEWPVNPDVLLTSKGLTNGTCAAAAVLVSPAISALFHRSGAVLAHAETQGGTAMSAAAISATIQRMGELDAVQRGLDVAARLSTGLDQLVDAVPWAAGHQGRGAFRSLLLQDADGCPLDGFVVTDLMHDIRKAGVIVHPGPSALQLIPSLTFSCAEVDELIDRVGSVLSKCTAAARQVAS